MPTKYHLNGKEFNLTTEDMSITSEHFNTDKQGNTTIISENATLQTNASRLTIKTSDNSNQAKIFSNIIQFINSAGYCRFGNWGWPVLFLKNYYNNEQIAIQISDTLGASISIGDSNNNAITDISKTGITTPKVTQTSKAESKKNFEKFENGLDIVKATDIYKYHLKSQEDTEKKEIGFVIGEEYKYAHDITSVDKEGNEIGVDTYSMISVAYKAIQELAEQNEQLQKEIQELKGEK